jgi:hypothetical protein
VKRVAAARERRDGPVDHLQETGDRMPTVTTRSPRRAPARAGESRRRVPAPPSYSSKRSSNAGLPAFPADVAIVPWHDGVAWRVGPRDDARSPLLRSALHAANRDGAGGAACAWALLLRADFSGPGLAALQAEVAGAELWELQPFLAKLAVDHPVEVAAMFPRPVNCELLMLCGEHGVAAAVRAAKSEDERHREEAASALAEFAERGVAFPVEVLHELAERSGLNADHLHTVYAALRFVAERESAARPTARRPRR